ncbi:hypothetical protein C0Q70_14820 [Pomacea canaliculata]|uniref:Uncharacterized protein n=1 Tax=Pomacea canaliculata TaxID=400727 RepID=A0A2T7NT44_POMCA|nr:hypothetical protein C0Q70_14820 [Pomacea canaliculata]
MAGLRAIRRLGEGLLPGGELRRLPGRNEHDNVVDALLSELDMHIKELERYYREKELEERRLRTGADYSWLISYTPKSYEMPQMERLELESLCYKVTPEECGKIISQFRSAMTGEPAIGELGRIMRCCILQWMTRQAHSLTSFRLKPPTRVGPSAKNIDVEMQADGDEAGLARRREARSHSMPDFSARDGGLSTGSAYPI